MGRKKVPDSDKEKIRNVTVRDELWIPFSKKYWNCSKKVREWIKRDLEEGKQKESKQKGERREQ